MPRRPRGICPVCGRDVSRRQDGTVQAHKDPKSKRTSNAYYTYDHCEGGGKMSAERDPETDQVAPVPNENVYVQDLVLADIEERKQHGIRKYGTALQVGNGRSMLQDAYEEVLDLAVYLRGLLEEERNGSQDS